MVRIGSSIRLICNLHLDAPFDFGFNGSFDLQGVLHRENAFAAVALRELGIGRTPRAGGKVGGRGCNFAASDSVAGIGCLFFVVCVGWKV